MRRWLAGQFARPSGWLGRHLIGAHLDLLSRDTNRLVLEALDVRSGEKVLEVGFGGGGLLKLILDKGADAIGIDVSHAMLCRAEDRFRNQVAEGRLALHLGSADRLPLDAAAVDKACSANALYFWPDPARVFAEFARVVRPGGALVLGFQSPEQVRKWPGHRHGFAAYEAGEIARLLGETGFGGIRISASHDRRLGEFLVLSARRVDAKAAP